MKNALLALFALAGILLWNHDAFAGLTLSQEKNGTTYSIDLTINKRGETLCAAVQKNEKIEEVYNVVIMEGEFPIHPKTFTVDKEKNRVACFKLSEIPDLFYLYIIKFEPETLVDDIEFPHIPLSQIPVQE